ncbi:hypothetical protein BFG60_2650 [Microcystis aeruginosa NIES-98]|nr:hypothetical protein BFG60_2650 [Microcystis aeruginosa NIES-98]
MLCRVKIRNRVGLIRVCGKKFFLGAGCGVWGVGCGVWGVGFYRF